jgi:Electron transfer DM13
MNLGARLALVPLVAAITVAGVWVAGGQLTDNFRVAMLLTALWFGAAGLAALVVGYRWRALRIPVIGTFVVVAAAIGVYLAIAMFRTTVVNEPIARGTTLARGSFVSEAHETTGRAQIVRLANDRLAINLVAFETDPGPDLRVYLVPGDGTDVSGAVDLGGLEGNKGTQQYDVPAGTDASRYGSVVIWCRAFSVSFGRAELQS